MKESKKEALVQFHRTNIIQAAEKLFIEKGIADTTVDDIVKAAGYSKATLYVYFKNKEEIIGSFILIAMQLLRDRMKTALTLKEDFKESYFSLCYTLVDFHKEHPIYSDILTNEINVDIESEKTPKVYRDIFNTGEEINGLIGDFLQKGITQGFVKQDLKISQTTFLFWASLSGTIRMAMQKEAYFTKYLAFNIDDFLRYSFETLLNSILVTEAERGGCL